MADDLMSKSDFKGGAIEYFLRSIVTGFLSLVGIFTLGILTAWASLWLQKWITRNSCIDGRQLKLEAGAFNLWVRTIIWFLLIIITVGFYAILGFYFVARQRWFLKRTHFAN